MRKKKLLFLGALTILNSLIMVGVIYSLQLTERNPFFYLFVVGFAGTPIAFFVKELGKSIKSNSGLVKLIFNWPFIVWCFGMVLSALNMLLLLTRR